MSWAGQSIPAQTTGSTIVTFVGAASIAWTDMPSTLTEFNANTTRRFQVNLAGRSRCRIQRGGSVVGVAGSEIRGMYSLNQGSTWDYLDGVSGPKVSLASVTDTQFGVWATIAAAARTDVIIAVWGILGNGTADPNFGNIAIEFE